MPKVALATPADKDVTYTWRNASEAWSVTLARDCSPATVTDAQLVRMLRARTLGGDPRFREVL